MLSLLVFVALLLQQVLSAEEQDIGCPGTTMNIQCPANTVIEIASADYGRHSSKVCTNYPDPNAFKNTNCRLDITASLQNRCSGKNSCTWNVDSTTTYDPCVGTYKYVTVDYNCIAPDALIIQIACQLTYLNLTCSPGRVINVITADYGRHNRDYCPSPENPFSQQNTNCQSNVTDMLRASCQRKETCSWDVDQIEYDPCVGTFKYVGAVYNCFIPCRLYEEYSIFADNSKDQWDTHRSSLLPHNYPKTFQVPTPPTLTVQPLSAVTQSFFELSTNKLCDNPCIRPAALQPLICDVLCRQGCICKEGYKRDLISGRCVHENYCPTTCNNNEVYSECNAGCQATCAQPRRCCTDAPCTPGYVCQENYVRDPATGKCVRPQDCRNRT